MKLIKRDTDYAIRAVSFIAKEGPRVVTVPDIVKALRVPRPFIRKILQSLTRKKILVSYKGRGGGFAMAARPGDISMIDLIEVFEGPLRINECLFKKALCPNRKTCIFKKRLDRIEDYVVSQLKKIRLSELIKK